MQWQSTFRKLSLIFVGSGLSLCCTKFAVAVEKLPERLYGNSLSVSWIDHRTIRAPTGEVQQRTQRSSLKIYISNAGRVFSKFDRSTGNRQGTSRSQISGDSKNLIQWNWEEGALVADQHFVKGARRLVIQFDPAWTSCTARLHHGRKIGTKSIIYKGTTSGKDFELLSIEVASTNCTIQHGNVFDG